MLTSLCVGWVQLLAVMARLHVSVLQELALRFWLPDRLDITLRGLSTQAASFSVRVYQTTTSNGSLFALSCIDAVSAGRI